MHGVKVLPPKLQSSNGFGCFDRHVTVRFALWFDRFNDPSAGSPRLVPLNAHWHQLLRLLAG